MFELSIARKYLIPKWRQLSVSIISLISVTVISLVVWLIVLFFSVTDGLEKNWVEKLVALTAPLRITPTEAYYNSYYYQVDGVSAASDYTLKSVGEKFLSAQADPYDPEFDQELPYRWPPADRLASGQLRDPVRLAFQAIDDVSGVSGLGSTDFEITYGTVRLRMLRSHPDGYTGGYHDYQTTVNQGSYLCSFDAENPRMARALQAPDPKDIDNLLAQADYGNAQALETEPESLSSATPQSFRDSVGAILSHYEISSLQVAEGGWTLPRSLLPTEGSLRVLCLLHGPGVRRVVLPTEQSSLPRLGQELKSEGYALKPAELLLGAAPQLRFADGTSQPLLLNTPLILEAGTVLRAQFESESLARARHRDELRFNVETEAQGLRLAGSTALSSLRIHTVIGQEKSDADAQWALRYTLDDRDRARLPVEEEWGAPILVARGYRKNGMALGDRGYLSYFAPTATSVQEQRLPIYVAGFFDPGVMPMGGKLIFASKDFVSLVRSSYDGDQGSVSNGINVWMDDLGEAEQVRSALQSRFDQLGISPYWKIETYREFDFTRDLIRQLQSERNVFTLIAIIIIIVACSNIISMLVILVNDKRQEIGILRSMGASAGNIASIFGVCGLSMGLVGGVLGTGAAMLTLHYLHPLIDLISFVQGYDAFNSMFYGDTLPNDLSYRALSFVFVTTLVISLLAGIIPAIKAARMRPSAILRSE